MDICINEIKRDTAAGPDKMGLKELTQLNSNAIALILNEWWGNKIPDCVKECRLMQLPKMSKDWEKVGNWRSLLTRNLFMRLYAKIWDNRLQTT